MVKRDSKIVPNPKTPSPRVQAWVESGGLDPEIQQSVEPSQTPAIAPPSVEPPTEPPKEKGKKYPHRISFDMETPQYKRLKQAAFDASISGEKMTMNDILRAAVEEWLKARDY